MPESHPKHEQHKHTEPHQSLPIPPEFYDVEEILSWHAPGRPFKQHSREYFINAFLITVAVEIILFFFSQYMLMVLVLSLVFLAFALASIPPRSFSYIISTEGILVDKDFFIWDELYDFYFMKIHGKDVLHVRTKTLFPGELVITLGDVPPEQIKGVLLLYLPFRIHVEPGFVQKAGDWLERNFPLERELR